VVKELLGIVGVEYKNVCPNVKIRKITIPPYGELDITVMRTNVTNHHRFSRSNKLARNLITHSSLGKGNNYIRIMLYDIPIDSIYVKARFMFPKKPITKWFIHYDLTTFVIS
jgi:hypothetical protein